MKTSPPTAAQRALPRLRQSPGSTGAPARVGRSTALMTVGTLLSRITGFIRSVVFLGFGVNALSDAYTVGNTTPNMIYELVAGGVLSAVLVPLFIAIDRKGTKRAYDGMNAIVSMVALVMLITVAAVVVFAPWIMWLFFRQPGQDAQRELAAQLLRMFAPQIAIYGFITMATASLNARRSFVAPMLAPVLNNLVVITVLLWARRVIGALTTPEGTTTEQRFASLEAVAGDLPSRLLLGFGTTAGVLAMGLALLPALRNADVRWRWHWEPRHPAVRELLRVSGWTVGYVIANQIALTYVTGAATSQVGGSTAYSTAYSTFFVLPHGLFAVSIMTALQPELSHAYLDGDRRRFRAQMSRGIRMILSITVPAAVGYLVLAHPIVSLLQNGSFDRSGASVIADVLRCFALGLPAFSVYLFLMNALKAMRNTKTTFFVNVIENLLNIVFAFVSIRLGWGVPGLAAAFTLAYSVSVFLALAAIGKRTRGVHGRILLRSTVRIAAAAAAMAAAVLLATWGVRWATAADRPLSFLPARVTEVMVGAGVGAIVYAVAATLLGVEELRSVLRGITRRIRRR